MSELQNLALVREGNAAPELKHVVQADANGEQVVFRVLRAAVCGTDRQILRGERPDPAEILGHEGVAEVVQVGPDTEEYGVGERVVFNPVNPDDQDEILGHSTDGLFQQFLSTSQTELGRRSLVERLPAEMSIERSVLAEPLGTVVYSHEIMARVRRPESLLVVGAGPIGILHALFARRTAMVPRVQIVCRSEPRVRWLESRAILPAEDILQSVSMASAPFDAAVLCTPARATCDVLREVLPRVADGGCIGLIGGVAQRHIEELPEIDLVQVRRSNTCGQPDPGITTVANHDGRTLHLFGHRGTSATHLREALVALSRDPVLTRVLTHRVSLAALPEVLETIRIGATLAGTEYVKAIVDCTSTAMSIEPIEGAA